MLEQLEKVLPEVPLATSVMREYGNLSSPSVLVALEKLMKENSDESDVWLCSFGAGFSAHSCEMKLMK